MINRRFFADDSFWNQPLPSDVAIADETQHYVELLKTTGKLHINVNEWTIPVYLADANTKRYHLGRKLTKCPLSQGHFVASQPYLDESHPLGVHESTQGLVPIPDEAIPDGENDAHMAVVDLEEGRVYDFWQVRRNQDGSWETNAAIAYDLDGPGVYDLEDFERVHNNESIHYYGPCRASGVPSVAGLIMHHEVMAGRIEHKLACACNVVGLQSFCYPPAVWTDGWLPGGIPEGITMQLNPDLDIAQFGLSPEGEMVCRALQEYGAVFVDFAHGMTLYAEGLFNANDSRSWDGILAPDMLADIGFEHFRFIQPEKIIRKGSHPVFHCGISALFYEYLRDHDESAPPPILD